MSEQKLLDRIPAPLQLFVAASLWGWGNVMQKTILEHVGPFTAVGLTSTVAAFVLLPAASGERRHKLLPKGTCQTTFVLPVVFFVLAIAFLQIGLGGTTVSNASFISSSSVILAPLVAWAILRERLNAGLLGPLAMTCVGLYMVTGTFQPSAICWGDMFSLLSAVFYSISITLNGRHVRRTGQPALLSAVQFAACGAICLCLGLILEQRPAAEFLYAVPEALLLGVFCKAIPYFLVARAQQSVSVSLANIVISAEAPISAVTAFLLLGETMSSSAITGAAIVIVAIVISEPGSFLRAARQVQNRLQSFGEEIRQISMAA